MEYLTTHDLVWVNNVITGKQNRYNYFKLEAVMAGQYSYGKSDEVLAQAANVLDRLLVSTPFESGNCRTAYIATLTFLNANGFATRVSDEEAARIIMAAARGEIVPRAAVEQLAAPADQALGGITLRSLITHECNHHADALRLLAQCD